MTVTLYALPASHPCATVARALALKDIAYERVDLLPVLHRVQQQRRFGAQTVPGLEIGSERIVGSREILRRLERMVPEPALYPADAGARAEVERAERWGDQVLQAIARRAAWACLSRRPAALTSYVGEARLPLPVPLIGLGARPTAMISARLNHASEGNVRADLAHLGRHLDRIERWMDRGVLGGATPNAADLQIGAGLRLLLTLGDYAAIVDGRPAADLARAQFPEHAGHVPAGALPAEWLPSVPS
jgi:glutathione S-transferase